MIDRVVDIQIKGFLVTGILIKGYQGRNRIPIKVCRDGQRGPTRGYRDRSRILIRGFPNRHRQQPEHRYRQRLHLRNKLMRAILLLIGLVFLGQSSWAYTKSGATYTVDGSSADTQAAVNDAPSGSIIQFKPGTYSWDNKTPVNVTKSLTLNGDPGKVLIKNLLDKNAGFMLWLKSGTDGHIKINGLNFLQVGDNSGSDGRGALGIDRSDMGGPGTPGTQYTVIFTNCGFDSDNIWNYCGWAKANGIIFSHCTFTCKGGLCGISFHCPKYANYPGLPTGGTWNTPDTMGLGPDNTGLNVGDTAQGWSGVAGLNDSYIEDSTLSNGVSGTCNGDDFSRVVIRHCTVNDCQIFSHGQDTSPDGNRHYEVYDCLMKNVQGEALNAQSWLAWRGAVALAANNKMDLIKYKPSCVMQVQQINRRAGVGACQTKYPANRQCGIGWSKNSNTPYGTPVVPQNGVGQISDPIYYWNNTGAGGEGYESYVGVNSTQDDCGNGLKGTDFIKINRDYFLSARPGWTPYTYPHPLLASGGGPTPTPNPTPEPTATPTPNPTPNPTATPTPTPQPTPTPAPVQTWEKWIEDLNNWIRAHPPTPDQR